MSRGGGMVYAVVSKTTSRKAVRVRLPLSAQERIVYIRQLDISANCGKIQLNYLWQKKINQNLHRKRKSVYQK